MNIEKVIAIAQEAVKAERERIFGVLHDMHDKTQGTHNYYLHAVMHIKAKSNLIQSSQCLPGDAQSLRGLCDEQ